MVMNMEMYKYHSCENSFLIFEYFENIDYSSVSKKLCKEYETDGLLILKKEPLEMLVFNKDGSEAKMCGNGIRCLIHYLYDKHYITNTVNINTKAGMFNCEVIIEKPFISVVDLGNGEYKDEIIKQEIKVNDKKFHITLFELGVLHAVVLADDFTFDEKWLIDLFNHPLLNGKANVNLVKPLNSNIFEIITFEKGVGFTKACGTGVAASGYVLRTLYNLDDSLIAICPGGILKVDINAKVYLTGESNYVDCYEVDL